MPFTQIWCIFAPHHCCLVVFIPCHSTYLAQPQIPWDQVFSSFSHSHAVPLRYLKTDLWDSIPTLLDTMAAYYCA